MKKQILSAFATATLLAALGACGYGPERGHRQWQSILKARVDALAEQMKRSGRPVTPEMAGQLKDEIVAREIFMQEAL